VAQEKHVASEQALSTFKSSKIFVGFRGINQLGCAFISLRWFKLAHICLQVTSLYRWNKQGINRKQGISASSLKVACFTHLWIVSIGRVL